MFKKTSLLAFFAMLFLVLVSFNVNAEQAEEAQKQTEEEDYDKMSEEQLRERIGDGDTDAMVEMGVRCFFEEEYTESRKLFQKAAKAGNSWGLRELGAYYSQPIVDDYNPNRGEKLLLEAVTEGEELAWFYLAMNWLDRVDPDESEKKRKGKMKKCVKYLEKSVEVGCAEGMLGLAYLYFDGNGVPQDSDKGISLLKKAIELGNPYAMLEMGCLYNCGEHVKQDTKLAKEWRDKAIKAGLDPEEATLDEPGDEEEVAENVAEEPVEELVEEVIKDYGQLTETKLKELINKDDTEAMVELGKRRYEKRNYKEAFTYFAAAANQGNVQGLLHCGVYYCNMLGPEYNLKKGQLLLKNAAQKGATNAWYHLYQSELDRLEPGGSRRHNDAVMQAAIVYLKKAAEANHIDGLIEMGITYLEGYDVRKDVNKGMAMLKKAADQNSAYAMYEIAWQYHSGRYIRRNTALAKEWYDKAIAAGLDPKRYKLN